MTAKIIPFPKRTARLADGIDGLWPVYHHAGDALGYLLGPRAKPHPMAWPYPEMEELGIEFDEDRE